jgi:peptidoglycan/xylan/chitin deacetylase (PgdA/CDA1 family)
VFVPSDFADGRGDLWWVKLEAVIEALDHVDVRLDGVHHRLPASTRDQKDAAFSRIYWWLRAIPEQAARDFVAELVARTGLDLSSLCTELILSWGELRDMARDPLVTIGAHTRRHLALAKLSRAEAVLEIAEGHARLEKELGRKIHHFSYPYGDETSAGPRDFEIVREAGFRTAVTTRKGILQATDSASPFGLCRLSLNGDYQKARYVQVLMSGLPFAILNSARRLRPTRGWIPGLTRSGRSRVAHTSS